MLVGHVDLNLTGPFYQKRGKGLISSSLTIKTEGSSCMGSKLIATQLVSEMVGLTTGILAVVFVELDQNRRWHHQEVSQRHGDGVSHHWEALAQPSKTLKPHSIKTSITVL